MNGWVVLSLVAIAAVVLASRSSAGSPGSAADCALVESKFDAWLETKDFWVQWRATEPSPPATFAEARQWLADNYDPNAASATPASVLVVTVPNGKFWQYTEQGQPYEALVLRQDYCAFGG